MHNLLQNVEVYISPHIRTEYIVRQNNINVSADARKAYLVVEEKQDCLRIVLPENKRERNLCMRSQLPGILMDLFMIQKSKAEKQIYRFINEVDIGTNELITDEAIPHVGWLSKTVRVQPLMPSIDHTQLSTSINGPPSSLQLLTTQGDRRSTVTISHEEDEVIVSSTQAGNGYDHRREAYTQIPLELDSVQDATEYKKVLEHIHSQAASVKWRNVRQDHTHTKRYPFTDFFGALPLEGNEFDAASRPTLFGSDGSSKKRLGAAGELFVGYNYTGRGRGPTLTRIVRSTRS